MYEVSNVCQIDNLTCFGCCGHHYTTEEDIREAIHKNTKEFEEWKGTITEFVTRSKFIRNCGVCFGVIEQDGKVFCPAHPNLNNGIDLRANECDTSYLCKAAFAFKNWDKETQNKFKTFIKSKNLDWYSFSIGMDNDTLLKEFQESNSI